MNLKRLTPENFTPDMQPQLTALFKQLNATISLQPIEKLLQKDGPLILVICEIDGKVAGMASMATYRVISGYKGMVEDVVVHENHRGKGIGRALMEKLVQEATRLHLTEILLFSGHHRTAAIALYTSLGFIVKNSGLYTLKLNS